MPHAHAFYCMLKHLLDFYRRCLPGTAPHPAGAPDSTSVQSMTALNRHAPLRHANSDENILAASSLLCREPLLGRDQRIAGYRFMLRESTRNRLRRSSRIVHHVYAEVLINNLLDAGVLGLLEHRLAVIEVPDTFLGHEALLRFPPANTVFAIECFYGDAAADIMALAEQARALRGLGYRIGIHASAPDDLPPALLAHIDLVLTDAASSDPGALRRLVTHLRSYSNNVELTAINTDTLEEFQYLNSLGARYFHGPFITRREQWTSSEISAEILRVRPLIDALYADAADTEVATQMRPNPAIVLRLLQHANSAAINRGQEVTSIEQAIQLVGRAQLMRWLMLVLLNGQSGDGHAQTVLETAMVRGRTLELLAPPGEGGNLFLVGLLSLVDGVLRVEMPLALDALGVTGQIRQAITNSDGPYARWLSLVIAWENADTERIEQSAQACGVRLESAADAYMHALLWTLDAPV